jgi:hypothetical protein
MSDIKDLQAGPPLPGVFQMGARPRQSPPKSERRAPPPFSLRLTFEERARLEREAGLSSNSKCNTSRPDGLRCCHANEIL